jgi:hypothetical protein
VNRVFAAKPVVLDVIAGASKRERRLALEKALAPTFWLAEHRLSVAHHCFRYSKRTQPRPGFENRQIGQPVCAVEAGRDSAELVVPRWGMRLA